MNIPTEILYKIAEESDDYIKTLKSFRIEPRVGDYKYVFKNVLNEIVEIDVKNIYIDFERIICNYCGKLMTCCISNHFVGMFDYDCKDCKVGFTKADKKTLR